MRRILLAASAAAMMASPFAAHAAGSSTSSDVSIGDVKRYVDKGEYSRAIVRAYEYLDENPRSADAYNYIGFSYRKQENYEKAQGAYDRALKLDANHVGAHEYYGELHITLGDLVAAETHLAALTRICGNCAEQQELSGKLAKAQSGS